MRRSETEKRSETAARAGAPAYPFAAVVGQEEMKLALLLSVVEPLIGGVLVTGHRGTAKSTAVRALAALLPPLARVRGCALNCDPDDATSLCADCRARLSTEGRLPRERAPVPVVELPLNATEDRVSGTLSLERALRDGARAFEPGLLARAHRGFLYVDEVNLLEDHLVDLLLDAAAAGRNRVEREGVSFEHAARFVLVGSSNPEEGELRPQLLDRFGLCVEVRTPDEPAERVRVVESREAFDRDPAGFVAAHEAETARLRRRLTRARRAARDVSVATGLIERAAELCARLEVDGHRGELTIVRAARALAALEGRARAGERDARRVAAMALRHRLRNDPLEQSGGGGRVEQTVEEVFGEGEEVVGEGEGGGPARGAREKGSARDVEAREEKTRRSGGATRRSEFEGGDGADSNGGRERPRSEGRAGGADGAGRQSQPSDAALSFDLSAKESRGRRKPSAFASPARARSHSPAADAGRGRYVRADARPGRSPRVAADATLRASAVRRVAEENGAAYRVASDSPEKVVSDSSISGKVVSDFPPAAGDEAGVAAERRSRKISAGDLRFKRFSRREGTLYVCAVDASGSMAVNRIAQAKGALARLLRRSYVRRDRVALVAFRGAGAELLLPPSRSAALAKRRLEELPVGGPTPLAAGLLRSLDVARAAVRRGAGRVVLLVFTDGRANVALDGRAGRLGPARGAKIAGEIERLGSELRRAGVTSVVVDTRRGFGPRGEGERLAHTLGASYARLTAAGEGELPI